MIYKYEMACRDAGLSEEKTAEIRRFFDAEQKRLKRKKKAMERNNITWFSISDEMEELGMESDFEIPDASVNVEDEVLYQMDMERLRGIVSELSSEDQEFLQVYFEEKRCGEGRVMERMGITRKKARCWKDRLIKLIRKRFFDENPDVFNK